MIILSLNIIGVRGTQIILVFKWLVLLKNMDLILLEENLCVGDKVEGFLKSWIIY